MLFQRPQVLGVKKEMKIAELIDGNSTIRKFGISMEIPSARIKVQDAIERNNDAGRWTAQDFVLNLSVVKSSCALLGTNSSVFEPR